MVVQGDVFFTKARLIPKGAKRIERLKRGYVIAKGEATGHAHVIEDEIELYKKDGTLFLRTQREVKVLHEEHLPVTLTKGIWKVGIVREYDPFLEETRRVRD